ncbi:isoaspartyl peptidase/L-asparaginase [Erpetoichthys calabaricus]|uniref:Isoaspartyl peptidase/L-asparaginase n=1 Tax=Erpetoichthys calabaricus TaxID=27687 RepID=A0A8C4T4G9_ERPCA|nr:isoaspartyl peptidase/L-asparaginase [Erpetoichthys calabaricus]XP_028676265.1 isoaspartyl peptidase/L-asparaginase [Erpetoichthys calabaricus]
MVPVVVVHGGSGKALTREEFCKLGVQEAALAGYHVLQQGGSALDAAEAAVIHLENNPIYNAGFGSALNELKDVEMDALIVDGRTLDCGAVAAVRRIANPIALSRLVMEKTNHVCLAGEGASRFAKAMGIKEVSEESLRTEYSIKKWEEARHFNEDSGEESKSGTVGAVVLDSKGDLASATSTGGMVKKMVGRVGDTPVIGCGGFADNLVGAVSATGHGEAIMKVTLSRLVIFHMEQGMSPSQAADTALEYMKTRVKGKGGIIVISKSGEWTAKFTNRRMAWATVKDGILHYGSQHGEHNTRPLANTSGHS